jgi:hypothetical protein
MRYRLISYSVTAVTMVGVLCLFLISTPAAQNQYAVPAQSQKAAEVPTPRLSDGHPDLTGYWGGNQPNFFTAQAHDGDVPNVHYIDRTADGNIFYDYAGSEGGVGQLQDDAEEMQTKNQASYKLEYATKVKQIASTMYGGTTSLDPQHDCKPNGVPRSGFGGFVVSSMQAVAMLYEASPGPYYRLIYTDGRGHPKDLDTSYMGHSVGHWDGDTLVVDTVGLNDETWLGGGKFTTIHSDKEHVVERITRKGNTITYEATVEDPVMLTKPWVITPRKVQLSPPDPDKYYIQPEMCLNNDKPHLIRETATDKFVCGWCQPDADKVYGPGAAADKAKADKEARTKTGVGGGE